MNRNTICLTRGLSHEDIAAGRKAFYKTNPRAKRLTIQPVTDGLMNGTVADLIGRIRDGSIEKGDPPSPDAGGVRAVLIDSADRNHVIAIMRSFKKALPDPDGLIFAMITDTARTWTFQAYFDHIATEHEWMKTHSPKENPDMRKMK